MQPDQLVDKRLGRWFVLVRRDGSWCPLPSVHCVPSTTVAA